MLKAKAVKVLLILKNVKKKRLADIQGKLSTMEMKIIMAGSGTNLRCYATDPGCPLGQVISTGCTIGGFGFFASSNAYFAVIFNFSQRGKSMDKSMVFL